MRNGYTALLPVGTCFFDKRNLNVDEVASIWGDGSGCTIQVMDRQKPDGKSTVVFVVGCGLGGYDHQLSVRHDQTQAYLGEYSQFGEVQIKDGKVVAKMVLKGRELPKTAPVHVYK